MTRRRFARYWLRLRDAACVLVLAANGVAANAARADGGRYSDTFTLTAPGNDDSVYAPPTSPHDDPGGNTGGVNFDLNFLYASDYLYRGIDRSEVGGHEDAPNFEIETTMTFDLGKLPHPFVGVFVNIFNADPVSRFQEIRPYFGLDYNLKPLDFVLGHNSYIYPERDPTNTSEIYGKLTLDDSVVFGTEKPIFRPYFYGAYDYDLLNGWYFEIGVSHDFVMEDWGLTITPIARVAAVSTEQLYARRTNGRDSGWQHYDLGFTVQYSLNTLLNVSDRFGHWDFQGQFFYTDNIEHDLRGDKQTWGGVGLALHY